MQIEDLRNHYVYQKGKKSKHKLDPVNGLGWDQVMDSQSPCKENKLCP